MKIFFIQLKNNNCSIGIYVTGWRFEHIFTDSSLNEDFKSAPTRRRAFSVGSKQCSVLFNSDFFKSESLNSLLSGGITKIS